MLIHHPLRLSSARWARDTEYTEKDECGYEENSEKDVFSSYFSASQRRSDFVIPAPIYGAWNVGPMHLSQHRDNTIIPSLRPLRLERCRIAAEWVVK
jgi:hypothetical protein